MNEFDTFIEVLETSVRKNGKDKVLTVGHILNLAKLANRIHQQREKDTESTLEEAISEMWNDTMRYGSGD